MLREKRETWVLDDEDFSLITPIQYPLLSRLFENLDIRPWKSDLTNNS